MKYLHRFKCFLLITLFIHPFAIHADPAITTTQLIFNYENGMRFTFKLNHDLLHKANWPDGMQMPPLAPRAAASIAAKQLAKLVLNPRTYEVITIALQKIDGTDDWYYEIDFSDRTFDPANNKEHKVPFFQVPVLLDGSTIDPKVDKAAPYDTSGAVP